MTNVTAGGAGALAPALDLSDLPNHMVVRPAAAMQIDTYDIDVDLSDLELLATALHDALTARHAGILGGPGVDDVALERAARRARRADATALLRSQVTPLRQMAGRAA